MSDADIRKRAEEIVSTWVSPQASTFNRDVDLVLAFADERVKAERERCAGMCERRAVSLREGAAAARQCATDIRSIERGTEG